MNNPNSPFYIIPDFISPLSCEQIVDSLQCYEPDTDREGNPIKATRRSEQAEKMIYEHLKDYVSEIESHYQVKYRATEQVSFDWHPHACGQSEPRCENATYVKKDGGGTWVKNRDRDISAILFLSDYQDKVPFDSEYEVYGGKVEFVQHRFGFNPNRGTLILYPSGPHFLNVTTEINFGDSFVGRFHIATHEPFLYDPKQFPGDFTTWLEGFA